MAGRVLGVSNVAVTDDEDRRIKYMAIGSSHIYDVLCETFKSDQVAMAIMTFLGVAKSKFHS